MHEWAEHERGQPLSKSLLRYGRKCNPEDFRGTEATKLTIAHHRRIPGNINCRTMYGNWRGLHEDQKEKKKQIEWWKQCTVIGVNNARIIKYNLNAKYSRMVVGTWQSKRSRRGGHLGRTFRPRGTGVNVSWTSPSKWSLRGPCCQ